MRLSEAAGWNQTESDWRRLLQLAPEACFALEGDSAVMATTTAICYERRLAWVGMVLTDPGYRRRGFASALMEHTLAALEARGIEWIKLDATSMGAPLYRQLGFVEEAAVERWGTMTAGPVETRAIGASLDHCAALDLPAFGTSRVRLLEALAPLGAMAVEGAYAMARPGTRAAYFGPCVSQTPEAARELLAWFLARHPQQPVCWDLLPDNAEAARLAQAFGFEPRRRLVRMVRQGVAGAPPLVHHDSRVFAIAGFEFG
jgi:GNAT superfamily N-acetyltransferase